MRGLGTDYFFRGTRSKLVIEATKMSELKSNSRRKFLKKSAYVVPVVMTMHAAPSLAGHGSKPKEYIKKPKTIKKTKNTRNLRNNKRSH